jgi:hypothetical protein
MSASKELELQTLVMEHRNLQALIQNVRSWWQDVREIGIPRFGEMASQLGILRSRLSEHFEHEESAEEETFKSALGVVSSAEVAAMAEQHCDILRRLDRIISKADASGGYGSWGDVGLEFGELIHAIDAHESEELRLLKNALDDAAVTTIH